MAGTAHFLRLLVETMEMGLNALVAAAFHYVDCVHLRLEQQQQHIPSNNTPNTVESSFSFRNCWQFGDKHVCRIAKDAGRLKQLEWVANGIMMKSTSTSSNNNKADHDAEHLRTLLLSETRDWRALAIRAGACLYRLKGCLLYTSPSPRD